MLALLQIASYRVGNKFVGRAVFLIRHFARFGEEISGRVGVLMLWESTPLKSVFAGLMTLEK